MNNYKNEILNVLLDRYERSSFFKGKSTQRRKIAITLYKLFPEYGKSDCYLETESIENAVDTLLKLDYVKEGKNKEFGNREVILNTNEEVIDKIYQEIGRDNLRKNRKIFLDEIDCFKSDGYIKDFLQEIKNRTLKYESLLPYLESNSVLEMHVITQILEKMTIQKEEISFRKFSILVLHDSKKLELYKNKIYHIIHDFYDDSIENEIEAFEKFNIIRNPSMIYIKGDMLFQINNQIIDLKELNNQFSFFSEHINYLKILGISAKRVITVENWTSFHDLQLKDSLIIYLGGFHSSSISKFLLMIYEYLGEDIEYLHFGDIDAGGFYIYLNLISKTGIPFQTWNMDIQTLKKFKDYTKPLTQNDRNRLQKLKYDYHNPIIDYMLEKNMKLEQEIITIK